MSSVKTFNLSEDLVVKDVNHKIIHTPYSTELWNGFGSTVHNTGSVVSFVCKYLSLLPIQSVFVTRRTDYVLQIPDEVWQYAHGVGARVVGMQLAALPGEKHPATFFSPSDDIFFDIPVLQLLSPYHVPWEQKLPIAFWRGGRSGDDIRVRVTRALVDVPQTDVKFMQKFMREDCNPEVTPELFGESMLVSEQFRYKALLFLDGNSAPSNATWVFASGSVPVMINQYDFWFKHKLVPWVHYVPVKYDLSDLQAQLQWIWEHDAEARQIAENALALCANELSPEKQRKYVVECVHRALEDPYAVPSAPST